MSIPLDRLYHYIESIAQEIRGGRVIIYRFYPHGSKKIEDLTLLKPVNCQVDTIISPHMYCNDQEPLNFNLYQNVAVRPGPVYPINQVLLDNCPDLPNYNLRGGMVNIYNQAILLHSERRSTEVDRYRSTSFIPVYYWNHAVLSLDWFRYAEHVVQHKNVKKTFLIYNRAWSGTREYRLGFADQLIKLSMTQSCRMACSPIDSTVDKHYELHHFANPAWRPSNIIENYFPISTAESQYSADFDIEDYEATEIEVVLETLFDDHRLHLTEKILRPIALGQPFILAGTHGSLDYLRSYGFKTFSNCWDESYDLEENPVKRLDKITELMKRTACLDTVEHTRIMAQAQLIADYNKKHFFSPAFVDLVIEELKDNLRTALGELETTNTSQAWIDQNKKIYRNPELDPLLYNPPVNFERSWIDQADAIADQYYLRSLKHNS